VEVARLCEGYNEVCDYILRMAEHMDSIKEGVKYVRGFMDHQEAREERRMQWVDERTI